MSGICSKHKHYDKDCELCNAVKDVEHGKLENYAGWPTVHYDEEQTGKPIDDK